MTESSLPKAESTGQHWLGRITSRVVVRRLLVAFVGTSSGAVLTFALQFVAARALDPGEFGKFSYGLGLFTIASMLAPLGFQTTLLKFLGQYKTTLESHRAAAVVAFARRWTLVGSGLALATMLCGGLITFSGDRPATLMVIALACVVPFAAFSKLLVSILRSTGKTASAIYLEVPIREGLATVLLVSMVYASISLTATHVGVAYGLSITISFAALAYAARRSGIHLATASSMEPQRGWISLTVSAFLLTGVNMLLRRFDVIIAGNVLGFEAAGVYAAALRFGDLLQLPLVAANMLVAPKIAELHSAGRMRELARLARNASLFSFVLSSVGSLPFLLFPEFVLSIFGSEFRTGSTVLRAMTIGQLVNALTGCAGLLLTMTGNEWRAVRVMAVVGTLSVTSNVLLAQLFGMDAMGIGSGVAIASWNIALLIAAHRAVGIWALPWMRSRGT